jgi:hypothetical protein
MKNQEKTAFPVTANFLAEDHMGLTKREYFSIRILQSLVSKNTFMNDSVYANRAVKLADELLKKLEEK